MCKHLTPYDKLHGTRADLMRTDAGWKRWSFQDLLEAIRQRVNRNPLQILNACIYFERADYKATDCAQNKTTGDRRKILSLK